MSALKGRNAAPHGTGLSDSLLDVDRLTVEFRSYDRVFRAVSDVSFRVEHGEFVGIVGENGSGKSTAALAILGITRQNGRIVGGSVRLKDRELTSLDEDEWRAVRGSEIGFVTQNPRGSFNPVLRIGEQIGNIYQTHRGGSGAQARARALELLRMVGINDPERRLRAFPHELSGGMAQRALIAAALSCEPSLLIADEPTTGLDVTVQAQVLDDLRQAATNLGTGVLLVTHDLGVVANYCDRIYLMHAGEVVEAASSETFFSRPAQPASLSLLAAQLGHPAASLRLQGTPIHPAALPSGCWLHPRCPFADPEAGCMTDHPSLVERFPGQFTRCHRADVVAPAAELELRGLAVRDLTRRRREEPSGTSQSQTVLKVQGVTKKFTIRERRGFMGPSVRHVLQACSDVTFDAYRGDTIGIIGESGSGKTTLARVICGLVPATSGEVFVNGVRVTVDGANDKTVRSSLQIVFQEPVESMNPMMTVGQQIVEPLRLLRGISRQEGKERAGELLRLVGLDDALAGRVPGSLSGGQLQRASIARALASHPDVVVLDEPTAQLSPEAEEHVLLLLDDLQKKLLLTYVYISHDLSLVRSICNRVVIMYLGQVVEMGPTEEVFQLPQHPYTRTLVSSILRPDPSQRAQRAMQDRLRGEIPSPIDLPKGCNLASRCQHVTDRCRAEPQLLEPDPRGRLVRCWRARAGEIDEDAAPAV